MDKRDRRRRIGEDVFITLVFILTVYVTKIILNHKNLLGMRQFPKLSNIVSSDATRPAMRCAVVYGGRIWATNAHVAITIPLEYFMQDEESIKNIAYKAIHQNVVKELEKTTNKSIAFLANHIEVTKKDGSTIAYPYYAKGVKADKDSTGRVINVAYEHDDPVDGFARRFAVVDEAGEFDGYVGETMIYPAIDHVIPEYGKPTIHNQYSEVGVDYKLLANLGEAFMNPNTTLRMYFTDNTTSKNHKVTRGIVVRPVLNQEYPDELGLIMPVRLDD